MDPDFRQDGDAFHYNLIRSTPGAISASTVVLPSVALPAAIIAIAPLPAIVVLTAILLPALFLLSPIAVLIDHGPTPVRATSSRFD